MCANQTINKRTETIALFSDFVGDKNTRGRSAQYAFRLRHSPSRHQLLLFTVLYTPEYIFMAVAACNTANAKFCSYENYNLANYVSRAQL